jgi:hypothetical protein
LDGGKPVHAGNPESLSTNCLSFGTLSMSVYRTPSETLNIPSETVSVFNSIHWALSLQRV